MFRRFGVLNEAISGSFLVMRKRPSALPSSAICLGLSDFFLTYTPVASPHVLGVQGRYFVIALPMAAIFMASLINLELPRGVPALIAITGSIIAGVTSVDAVLKAHW